MRTFIAGLAALALSAPMAAPANEQTARTPGDVVDAAPASEWRRIPASDLLVMDLAADPRGQERRVVIQLIAAPFSQGWVSNIRKLVAARWFDGTAVVRVQDNYVAQWGDPDGEIPGKARALPRGLSTMAPSDYTAAISKSTPPFTALLRGEDPYLTHAGTDDRRVLGAVAGFSQGWPVAMAPPTPRSAASTTGADAQGVAGAAWPLHCYGMVGVGRNLSPDTGTGAELYAVIGHAPRQLDRNVALVGRVISGIEHLSSLPRGTGEIGFYKTAGERTPIVSVRTGDEVPGLASYEYLSTDSASFAAYVDKRANRLDDFYIQPAGGVDVCNVPVPIREAKR
ncbi:peptidylprolyl isomerase [Novosphingobium sp. FGD1]|uniref:Peptidylprolyl isomerase n=1 Tax=Novosphingobium silvae TaxID=2692619 RepID=A0A7X4GHA0_9SPHN|nr:peptidylprolyl isomerase [Novosphingobium silvae]MYL98636.1 peptidylprolyl isomerase [Novosphingobium silvae]